MRARVSGGSGSPKRSTAARPAVASIQERSAPAAASTACMATVISGPMPSPAIRTTGVAKTSLPQEDAGILQGFRRAAYNLLGGSTPMKPHLPASWQAVLAEEFSKPYFKDLQQFVALERRKHT